MADVCHMYLSLQTTTLALPRLTFGMCLSLQDEVLGKDPSTFFTFDFFMHETQATPVVASNAPTYNTLIQYVVDNDPFLVEYLDTHVLELELNRCGCHACNSA